MINPEKRKSVFLMHKNSKSISEISRMLELDRKSVRMIIQQGENWSPATRSDSLTVDEEMLRNAFFTCERYAERTHEYLKQQGVNIAYSTLTKKIRELNLRDNKSPKGWVPDSPGSEFQHDTSLYNVMLGEKRVKLQASLLYYRYSKCRYLRFYSVFNRFMMKCFFHQAITYYGFSCRKCIIDNTHLAVDKGSGKNAIFSKEMVHFAKLYGFFWMAHEIKHSNRKAGVERGFRILETNFFPGRRFSSLEDLNDQAQRWCDSFNNTPNKKTKLIPREQFQLEIPHMKKVSSSLPAPYLIHHRQIDQYGYIAFGCNSYWIPRSTTGEIALFQYADSIKIYGNKCKLLTEYPLPPFGVRDRIFTPKGINPGYRPRHHQVSMEAEEKYLLSLDKEMKEYLGKVLIGSSSTTKHRYLRMLFHLQRKMGKYLFLKAIFKSMEYGVYEVDRLEGIAVNMMKGVESLSFNIPKDKQLSENYITGEFTEPADFSRYEKYEDRDNEKRD